MIKQNISEKKPSRRKVIVSAIVLSLLIITALSFIYFTQQEPKPDPASEAIIRKLAAKQLKKDPNELTDEDFAEITEFNLIDVEKGLKSSIFIKNVEISDIKFLEKFTNMESLILSEIVYPQSAIPKWMKILAHFGIFDLNKKTSVDLSPLINLSRLKNLTISGTTVKNIKPLLKLNNLEKLSINNAEYIKNLKYISALKNLNNLSLYSVSSCTYVTGLINLKELALSIPLSCSLEPLRKLKNLENLTLNGAGICDLEPISNLAKLHDLSLRDTKVSDLTPIKKLVSLEYLWLCDNPIYNIEPLKGLTRLEDLNLYQTQVSDIESLRTLSNLTRLNLNGTPVDSIEPLKGLTNLTSLSIYGTSISNIEPLQALLNLKQLDMRGCNNITDKQVEELQKALPELKIDK